MANKLYSCVNFFPPTVPHCPYSVSGEEAPVIEWAVDHLMAEHGSEDTPQLRQDVKASLVDAP